MTKIRDISRRHVLGGALGLAGVASMKFPAFAQAQSQKAHCLSTSSMRPAIWL